MGGAVFLGLVCVILVIFIGNGNEVKASPVPDICSYFRPHKHHHREETTTAEPSDDEDKADKKGKVEQLQKLLGEFLLWDETTTTKKPKKKSHPKSEPKSMSSMDDSFNHYFDILVWLYNAF